MAMDIKPAREIKRRGRTFTCRVVNHFMQNTTHHKRSMWAFFIRLILSTALLGSIGITLQPPPKAESGGSLQSSPEAQVEAILRRMTPEQKVGQMFMITVYSPFLLDTNAQFIRDYAPGAVALFKSNLDYQPAHQVTFLINSIQEVAMESSGVPMLVAVDQEGGRVIRLINGFTLLPPPLFIGAAHNTHYAFQMGQALGRELRGVGVNMNLAPVVDLHTREDALNPLRVLNQRTLGEDPRQVGKIAGQLVEGMGDAGVIGVIKHFPGHSPTTTDTHRDIATITLDEATFEATNLRAFATAIEGGAEVVMVGHLYYPALEPTANLPATLSPTLVGILRDDLDFDGVIMTDAMDMGAILNYHAPEEAAMLAIEAGVDLIAMGPNMSFSNQIAMLERINAAVTNGEISLERIEESARRVLLLKARHGLLDWQPLEPLASESRIAKERTSETLVDIFSGVVTILRNESELLPLRAEDKIAIIYPIARPQIAKECSLYLPNAEFLGYSLTPADWEFGAAVSRAREVDKIVAFGLDLTANRGQAVLIGNLDPNKTIFVSLGSPYDWENLVQPTAGLVLAYSDIPEAQIAACRVLSGIVSPQGILPIAIEGFEVGDGLGYDGARFTEQNSERTVHGDYAP